MILRMRNLKYLGFEFPPLVYGYYLFEVLTERELCIGVSLDYL